MIVSLVLLAILTLGAVSATDNLTASETPDLDDELGVSDADIPMEEDVGEEIGDEFDGDDRNELWDYYSSCPTEYLIGENTCIGMGIPYEVYGNISVTIDEIEVYNQPVIKYNWKPDPENPIYGGNYIYLNELKNLNVGKHDYKIMYSGDQYCLPKTLEGSFEAYCMKVNVPDEVMLGCETDNCIAVKMAYDATGNINVLIDDELFFSKSLSQARGEDSDWIHIYLDNLTFGKHNYTVSYFGGNYDDVAKSGEFNLSYYIEAYSDNNKIRMGDEAKVYAVFPSDISSVPVAVVNNKTYEFEMDGNRGEATLTDFTLGKNVIRISYQDEKYPLRTIELTIRAVYYLDVPYYVSYNSGDSILMRMPRDAKGNLSVYENESGDLIRTVSFENGEASISLSDLSLGKYSLIVKYEGDDYEIEDNYRNIMLVPNVDCPAKAYIENDYQVTAESPEDARGNLTISICYRYFSYYGGTDDEDPQFKEELYNGPAKGNVNCTLPKLDSGYYYLYVKYSEDDVAICDRYYPLTVMADTPDWTMKANIPKVLIIKPESDNILNYLPGNMPFDIRGKLTLLIDGVEKSYFDFIWYDFHVGEYWYSGLSYGTHTWELRYSGDDYYNPTSANGTLEVSPMDTKTNSTDVVDPKVVATKTSALYTAKYSVTVYGNDGKVASGENVVFKINGKTVKTVTANANGVASFNIPFKYLPGKKYTITATALGITASKKVTINQILAVKAIKLKKSAKKVVVTATLKKVDGKYIKGKYISLKINGKTIKAKTNKKGVAKLTIKKSVLKKLKVGKKYKIKVTYLKATVNKTVKVKK